MRHRKLGRHLGRTTSHRIAMLKNMASSMFLTERATTEVDENAPKIKGRIITTRQKAKEAQRLIEKCVTLARRSLPHSQAAERFGTDAPRNSAQWKTWRGGGDYAKWRAAIAPALALRRHALRLLGDKQAVQVLFNEVGPRFENRPGGYTRIVRLAKPRLGDAGERVVLEFVGVNDRASKAAQRPAFEMDETKATAAQS